MQRSYDEGTPDRGVVEGKCMDIAPVQAIVLAHRSRKATSGTVLLSEDTFPRFGDKHTPYEISTVSALNVVTRARAVSAFPQWDFEGEGRVYDYNPTDKPLKELNDRRPFNLQLREGRKSLANDIIIHGLQDLDTGEVVQTFFVLLVAFEEQSVQGTIPAGIEQFSAFADALFSKAITYEATAQRQPGEAGNTDDPTLHHLTVESTPGENNQEGKEQIEMPGSLLLSSARRIRQEEKQRRRARPNVIALPENVYWMDDPSNGSRLVVRSCYEALWNMIKTSSRRRFVVSGSPGIGKSWFLYFCMYMLAADETPFVYILNRRQGVQYYLFRDGRMTLYPALNAELARQFSNPAAYVLIDDRPPISTTTVRSKVILCSSDRENYKRFVNDEAKAALQLWMPVWSDAELDVKRLQHAQEFPLTLTAEQVQALVNIAGRIPLYIFQCGTFAEAVTQNKRLINEAVRKKPADKMLETAGNLTDDDKNTSYRILCVEVNAAFEKTGLGFHSQYTKHIVYNQLTSVSRTKLFNYYRWVTQGSLQGNVFEWYAHHRLAVGARVLEQCLEDDAPWHTERQTVIEAANNSLPVFGRTRVDLLGASENEYLVPALATFEAVDAVCLPRFYQMTVSGFRPIKLHKFATFLIRLSSRPENSLQGEIPFVFIVPREQMSAFENQPFKFFKTSRMNAADMENHLRQKIAEAEKAAESSISRATKRARDVAQADGGTGGGTGGGAGEGDDDGEAKFKKLQDRAELARLILHFNLLGRIKRYVWGVTELDAEQD